MVSDKPKLSIITVCYKEPAERIRGTFANISSQDYDNLEWIVVDGGSPESTVSAIREFTDRIKCFISEPDSGLYDAMNKGIAHASGDFVIFMNVGDAFISTGTLSEVAASISASPSSDCYYGDVVKVSEDGRSRTRVRSVDPVSRYVFHWTAVCHQATFSRRALYDRIGLFDLRYHLVADQDWNLRSLSAGAKWMHVPLEICEYDASGLTSNPALLRTEYNRLRLAHYNPFEMVVFCVYRKVTGIGRRIRRWCKAGP